MIVKCPRGLSKEQLIDYLMLEENAKVLLQSIDIEDIYTFFKIE